VSDDRSGTHGGTGDGGTVVVGLDDSVSAAAAVDFAAGEATVQGVPLRIVHAHPRPAREPPLESRALLDSALERVTRLHPDLEVQHTIVGGGASEVLVDESGRAELLVLGGLGVGELADLLTGSVLARVLARAHCPVMVTGSAVGPTTDDNPVRVAMDGTVGSLNALRFGCDWALRHSTWVEAIHVEAIYVAPDEFDEPTPLELRTPARLDDWITTVHREYGTVSIRTVTVHGTPVPEALVAASHGAQVMAVGAGHRVVLAGLALGPVLHDLVHKAACPVAVVRGWRGD
jgi:nucleotide-binding universal stress UspA family protein